MPDPGSSISYGQTGGPKFNPDQELKELAKDDDIVILPADKGRATVVMDRKDYSAKMLTMLGDRDTYQPMAKDQPPP